MNIKGKKVVLRAREKDDLELLHKWSNDPEINYLLGGWHFPSSLQDQEKWFNTLSLNSNNQRFAIDTADLGLIGMANLVDINWKDRNGFHGMLLGDKDMRGKGYGVDTRGVEGIKKNHYFRKNQWWDEIIVGITREDYFNLINESNYWNFDK